MIVLVGETCKRSWVQQLRERGWGRMWTTKRPSLYPGEPWGLDNGAYSDWLAQKPFDGDRFRRWLDRAYRAGTPYLAVVPDLVAMGQASLEFSEAWRDELPDEWPWYLAVQDGVSVADVECVLSEGRYRGLFLGGTNRFKATAAIWRECSRKQGVRFHYGRCGTANKIRHAFDVGADSLDSSFPLWTEERMQRFAEMIRNPEAQYKDPTQMEMVL